MSKKTFGSLLVLGGALLFTYLKFNQFQNKKCKEEQSVLATVISKESKTEMYTTSLSSGIGCSYIVRFRTSDGRELELSMCEVEFNGLNMGMNGKLTFVGDKFVKFREIVNDKKESVVEKAVIEEESEEDVQGLRELTEEEVIELMREAGKVVDIGIEEELKVERVQE